jgi:hypothetical protein
VADDPEDRVEQLVHDSYQRTPAASTDLRARILRGLDDHDRSHERVSIWRWWWRPAPLRLAGVVLAAACVLVIAGAWVGGGLPRTTSPTLVSGAGHPERHGAGRDVPGAWIPGATGSAHEVAFMLVAPG